MGHLGIEIGFVDEPLGIAVNEPGLASLEMPLVFFQRRRIDIAVMILFEPLQTLFVFLPQAFGMLQ